MATIADTLKINLPPVNGLFEAGIAVGLDPSLPEAEKLPILRMASTEDAISYAAQWANTTFAAKPNAAKQLYVNGAVACIGAGLCTTVGTANDGDWIMVEKPSDKVKAGIPPNYVNRKEIHRALTLIVATKANWWTSNHHTGQANQELTGYVKKVMAVFELESGNPDIMTAAHTIGHWASTISVLTAAGVAGLKVPNAPMHDPLSTMVLSEDAKLRFTAQPAGTHRLVVCHEAAKRLSRSKLAKGCRDVSGFIPLAAARNNVMAAPASYHIGAHYLTGSPRAAYDDSTWTTVQGRLGTFIRSMYLQSTLAKSPHFTETAVVSADDYDPEWKNFLASYKAQSASASTDFLKAMIEEQTAATSDDLESFKSNF